MLGSAVMDAARALADLTAVSSQIDGAVLAGTDGAMLASTFSGTETGRRVAEAALALLRAAERSRGATGAAELSSVVAEAAGGGVFVVRDGDRFVAAVTGAEPTVGLVLYDLKTCLRLAREGDAAEAGTGAGDDARADAPGTGGGTDAA